MDTKAYKGVPYPLYDSYEEFREHEPNAVFVENWREAKLGEYIQAEDGKVMPILNVLIFKKYKQQENIPYFVTRYGYFVPSDPKDEMKFKGRGKTFSTGTYVDTSKSTDKFFAQLLSVMIIAHGALKKQDLLDCARLAYNLKNPTDRKLMLKVIKTFQRKKDFMDIIRTEIKAAAEKAGLNEDWVFKQLKNLAEKSDSDKVKLDAVKEVKDIIAMGTGREVVPAYDRHRSLPPEFTKAIEAADTESEMVE